MKTLVLANQKGGVGKSAIATQLSHYLFRRGKSVLVIDLDHQQNTSAPLRLNSAVNVAPFSASGLFYEGPVSLPAHPFVLVPGDDGLSGLEREAGLHNRFAGNLRATLSAAQGFDICIIDTNPNPDIRYASALISAGHVLAPVQLNQEAVNGIAGLLNHSRYGIARIRSALNQKLVFLGILPNLVEPTPFQRANLKALITRFGDRLLSAETEGSLWFAHIPKRSSIAEAQAAGLFLPDLGKTGARDAWREIRPVFDLILLHMGVDLSSGAVA